MKPQFKTVSEQKLEWFESLNRPLTDEESEELQRVLHAVYMRNQRLNKIAQHRKEELDLLRKLRREAQMPSPLA